MNRLQTTTALSLVVLLSSAGVALADRTPNLGIEPPNPRSPRSCEITTTAYSSNLFREVQYNKPSNLPYVPFDSLEAIDFPDPGSYPIKENPSGRWSQTRGDVRKAWNDFQKAVREIGRTKEVTSSAAKRRLRTALNNAAKKLSTPSREIAFNENSFQRAALAWNITKERHNLFKPYNDKGDEIYKEGEDDLDSVYDDFWTGDGSEAALAADEANATIASAKEDAEKAARSITREKEYSCEEVRTMAQTRDAEIQRIYRRASDNLRSLHTRAVNEVRKIEETRDASVSLENLEAQEEIEDINATAERDIIAVMEQYEGEKIDENNSAQSEISSIALDAAAEKKSISDSAADAREEEIAVAQTEIRDLTSAASDEKSVIREDANTRLSEIDLEFRDTRSSISSGLNVQLRNVRARFQTALEELRKKRDAAEATLRKRPGANWPGYARRQLLQAQRKAERVYVQSVNGLRNTKAKRDSQLASVRTKFQERLAASKKAERARRARVERDYQREVRPIDEELRAEVVRINTDRDSALRRITDRASADTAEIDAATKTQTSALIKVLSETLLRLDRQKTNESTALDKDRDIEVVQRERARVRAVAEIEKSTSTETEDIWIAFEDEKSALVDDLDGEMRNIDSEASAEIKEENRRLGSEVESLEEDIKEARDDAGDARRGFNRTFETVRRDWKREANDVREETEGDIDEHRATLDNKLRSIATKWSRSGSEGRRALGKAKEVITKNAKDYKKDLAEARRDYNRIKIKKD